MIPLRKATFLFLLTVCAVLGAPTGSAPAGFVLVPGGTFRNPRSNYFGQTTVPHSYIGRPIVLASFYIGRTEVTQKEWSDVMGSNPSQFQGADLPVERVSWYDAVEYCNRRSKHKGLAPYYTIDRSHRDPNNRTDVDVVKWVVTINAGAKGYRLPTEAEWEYAATGGQLSRGFLYSGSNDVEQVAWYYKNSGDRRLDGFWNWSVIQQNHNSTHPVGAKGPNELGLYDMAGNVREWCWNWYGPTPDWDTGPSTGTEGRVWRGGGWMGGDFCCASTWRAGYEASGRAPDQGLRLCRDQ